MKEYILGIDIGGTKCGVILGEKVNSEVNLIDKHKFAAMFVDETIRHILSSVSNIIKKHALRVEDILALGISCGGAIVTPLLGIASDSFGTQIAAIFLIDIVWLYIIWLIFGVPKLKITKTNMMVNLSSFISFYYFRKILLI